MGKSKLRAYAITIVVKPLNTEFRKFKAVTYKGVSFSESPKIAKERSILQILDVFKDLEDPIITRDNLIVKSCLAYNDFLNQTI